MVLRERALRRKVRELEPDDASTAYRQLCDALGDLDGTELGEAAKKRQEPRPRRGVHRPVPLKDGRG
jgi:hypothetical protein